MALDLNKAPPDDEGSLPDLNKPVDDEAHYDPDGDELISPAEDSHQPVEGGEALPDLNEQPANYGEFFQMHEAQREINVNDGDLEALEEELHEYGIAASELDIVFDEEELEDSTDEGDEHASHGTVPGWLSTDTSVAGAPCAATTTAGSTSMASAAAGEHAAATFTGAAPSVSMSSSSSSESGT